MKKKILLTILIIVVIVGSFFIGRQVGLNTEQGKTTVVTTQEKVSTQDIKKTLTGSGSVSSKTTEKLELDTSKYFSAMCVEEDDTVKAGSNILEYTDGTYLTADSDLVIISVNVPDTESKCQSSNYIEVSYLDNLTTTLSISENEINNVEVGQEVEITLSADESKTYTGKITKLDSVGTYSSSGTTFTATVEFENDGNVKLGMSVSCVIILQEEKDVICVPIEGVYTNSNGESYVVKINDDGSKEEVIVETGIADENYVQVVSGLSLNDTIEIETEITENSSSSSQSSKDSKSGFGGSGEMGQMPGGGGERPSDSSGSGSSGQSKGEMPSRSN